MINEWFVMRLAKRLGLDVPNVHRRYVPSPVYVIDRFDRFLQGQAWQRRHVLDACQLLGLASSFKYSQGSVESLAALSKACRSAKPGTLPVHLTHKIGVWKWCGVVMVQCLSRVRGEGKPVT